MRVYYIFIVNDFFSNFYNSRPSSLYKIFEQVYNLNNNDIILGYRIFEQIAIPFNKNNVNEYIYNRHCGELSYSRNVNVHIIKNLYYDEISKLIVYNSHLKIKTNINYSSFLDTQRL